MDHETSCGGCCGAETTSTTSGGSPARAGLLRGALRLEYFTIGWNIIEGLVAITAASLSGSVALLGFGIDSFVESTSGGILVWRLQSEGGGLDREEIERLDHRARKLVAVSLFALAAYVSLDAVKSLWLREQPHPSFVGMALTATSLVVMMWLAREKRRAARALESRAMEADAFQTTACWWLSLITFGGIGINALLGWWWADPVAALGMAYFIVREGRGAWEGKDDCCG